MSFRLAIDGDDTEKQAWSLFVQTSFPSYEAFWQKHVVPLTGRPSHIFFLDDAALKAKGKEPEDVALAQLHYSVLQHLIAAYRLLQLHEIDSSGLFTGLSRVCPAQDVAFEILERFKNRGKYDPWIESRQKRRAPSAKLAAGQDAQENWKKANQYPLQTSRDYRNKLMHGRVPPAIFLSGVLMLPAVKSVEKYCDWREATGLVPSGSIARDFATPRSILAEAWQKTVEYLENSWQKHLL